MKSTTGFISRRGARGIRSANPRRSHPESQAEDNEIAKPEAAFANEQFHPYANSPRARSLYRKSDVDILSQLAQSTM